MTKEEAIETLRANYPDACFEQLREAFDTAISALSRQVTGKLNSDCISRQAAITLPVMPKEHREYQTFNIDDAYEQGWNDLQKCIEALPSAERNGKWIKVRPIGGGKEAYMCPFCRSGDWDISVDSYNYCPYCGESVSGVLDDPSHPFADDVMMEGEEDG